MIKISEHGQITIPPVLREKYGYLPQTEIDFEERDGALLLLVRHPKSQPSVPKTPKIEYSDPK